MELKLKPDAQPRVIQPFPLSDYGQLRLELHVKNKRDLAWFQDSAAPAPVYSAATKLGSAIKAAAASGVQVLYVDSVLEMEKIKKFHPSARFVIHYKLHASFLVWEYLCPSRSMRH